MPTQEEIIQALGELDPAAFEQIITKAYQSRQGPLDSASRIERHAGMSAAEYADWIAHRHLSSDAAIERVVYLPTAAPEDEIRLLEINRFLHDSLDDDKIEPLDFSPDDEPGFRVFVADITREQWERVKADPASHLPPAWNLKDNRIFTR